MVFAESTDEEIIREAGRRCLPVVRLSLARLVDSEQPDTAEVDFRGDEPKMRRYKRDRK